MLLRRRQAILAAVVGGRGGGPVAFSDDFARADGDLGNGWNYSAGLWTIASGQALGNPGVGTELHTDPGIENWNDPNNMTNWAEILVGTSTINQDTSDVHGGLSSCRIDVSAANENTRFNELGLGHIGEWLRLNAWRKVSGGSGSISWNSRSYVFSNTTWGELIAYDRPTVSASATFQRNSAASQSIWYDDLSVKPLTVADMFCTQDFQTNSPDVSVEITRATNNPGGLVLCLDDPDNPQNYILAYILGTASQVQLDKVVSGTYTNLIAATSITYGAGKVLRVVKSGTSVSLYYDGVQIGTTQTVSDAAIVSNTQHGLFSVSSNVQFDNFALAGP